MTPPVFGITGWKNSGKTTLVERVVAELSRRGYRISTIKHAHHEFDIDHEGTDSYRHRAAGAVEVALVSGYRWALMHELRGEEEPSMADVIARLAPCDLVIIEGYKSQNHNKIEVRRQGASKSTPLTGTDPAIIAVASDAPAPGETVPVFDLNDVGPIADFIVEAMALGTPRA